MSALYLLSINSLAYLHSTLYSNPSGAGKLYGLSTRILTACCHNELGPRPIQVGARHSASKGRLKCRDLQNFIYQPPSFFLGLYFDLSALSLSSLFWSDSLSYSPRCHCVYGFERLTGPIQSCIVLFRNRKYSEFEIITI